MSENISIKRAVLHILDKNSGMPILSKEELETGEELVEYLSKHIEKVLEDPNTKKARFADGENGILNLFKLLNDNEEDFLPITSDAANKLFALMQKHVDIPSADLVCCLLEAEGRRHIGILKMNYKEGFTHWVHSSEEGNVNTIIRHQTLLPQEGQRLDECILVDLSDFSIRLLEKQFEIDGEKEFYLSRDYLQCSCKLSDNAKLKILNKVTKDINKKYFDEDIEKAIKMKKAVSEGFEESASINIEKVADRVFDKNTEVRREYVENIRKAGLEDNDIPMPDKLIEKKFKTQRIKTDSGIEIDFPLEFAGNRDKIEFVNNPDGTISIIIKNVSRITNR